LNLLIRFPVITKKQKTLIWSGPEKGGAYTRTQISSAVLTNASFVRLKNLALYYSLPEKLSKKMKFESCRFYLQSQNLLTITKYVGADPENQSLQALPPLRVFTIGINMNF
jgi:hypothetical protein